MKIKFIAYFNKDKAIYNFINDIWNVDGAYDDILTCGNDHTHLVVFCKAKFRFPKENTYGIIMEPFWSPNFDKGLQDRCNKLLSFQPEKYPNNKNVLFHPLILTHRLYECPYHGEIIYKENTTRDILKTNFVKSKKLSIILSRKPDVLLSKTKYPEALYYERDQLVRKLMDSDLDFDLFGQDWDIKDDRYKGFISNKIEGLRDYEYTIALENSNIPGYITDRISDPVLCGTIPIYNGAPDVDVHYPNSCEYLEYDGNEIERIRGIINSGKTASDYDFENTKHLFLNEYNPIRIIKQLIETGN